MTLAQEHAMDLAEINQYELESESLNDDELGTGIIESGNIESRGLNDKVVSYRPQDVLENNSFEFIDNYGNALLFSLNILEK